MRSAVARSRSVVSGRLRYWPWAQEPRSDMAAAALWDLRPVPNGDIDGSISARSGRRKRQGIKSHRSGTLFSLDVVVRDGIPVTSVARTLLDLADVVSRRELERALDRAEQLRLFDLKALQRQITQGRGRPGAALLRACLVEHTAGSTLTESETKERFLPLVCRAGLTQPAVNEWMVLADGTALRPDYLWSEHRLIVELDGFGPHSTRQAFRADRRRDRKLRLEGWRVLRFTYADVTQDPHGVVAELRVHTS